MMRVITNYRFEKSLISFSSILTNASSLVSRNKVIPLSIKSELCCSIPKRTWENPRISYIFNSSANTKSCRVIVSHSLNKWCWKYTVERLAKKMIKCFCFSEVFIFLDGFHNSINKKGKIFRRKEKENGSKQFQITNVPCIHRFKIVPNFFIQIFQDVVVFESFSS